MSNFDYLNFEGLSQLIQTRGTCVWKTFQSQHTRFLKIHGNCIRACDSMLQYSIFLVRYWIFSFIAHRIGRTFPGPPPEVEGLHLNEFGLLQTFQFGHISRLSYRLTPSMENL